MKKLLAIVLALTLVLSMAACGAKSAEAPAAEAPKAEAPAANAPAAEAPADEDITIGWISCDFAAPSVARSRAGAEAVVKELGINFVNLDSEGDAQKETDNILNLMSQGVDGVIIEPTDMEACIPGAKQLAEAGIPVIIFDQDFPEEYHDLRLCYVGGDDYALGYQGGLDAIEYLGEEGGNVALVNGMIGSTPATLKAQGFRDAIADHPEITLLDEQFSPWDRAKAVEIMEDYITRFGEDLDFVYCADDNLAIGAVEALRSAGLSGKIGVTGYNGMADAFELIKSGEMYSTVIQPLYVSGGKAVQCMYDYLHGATLEPFYYNEMVAVYADNVDQLEPEW